MKTRIQYLYNSQRRPIGCIALVVDRHNKRVNYQLSVCHPADKFDTKEARLVALTRLIEKPLRFTLPNESNLNGIAKTLMTKLTIEKGIPTRAVKAAQAWLKSHPLNAAEAQVAVADAKAYLMSQTKASK